MPWLEYVVTVTGPSVDFFLKFLGARLTVERLEIKKKVYRQTSYCDYGICTGPYTTNRPGWPKLVRFKYDWHTLRGSLDFCQTEPEFHTMDMLWEKFRWILPLYMTPINFQSKASVVCSVTTAPFFYFCLKKLNVFSQHIGRKINEYLNSTE